MVTELDYHGVVLRQLPGHDDYWGGQDGHIYSTKNGSIKQLKELSPPKMRGLLTVSLYRSDMRYDRRLISGKVKSCVRPVVSYIHRLIAVVWLPPQPSPLHEIDHIDEDRSNNTPGNLRWLTKLQNSKEWLRRHPEKLRGSGNAAARLTEADITGIRALRGRLTGREVGDLFSVHPSTIYCVWHGRTWRHVP